MIEIEKSVLKETPDIFKVLNKNHTFRLTKLRSSNNFSYVDVGQTVVGTPQIIEVLKKPALVVSSNSSWRDYIRTSPIVEILELVNNSIIFKTQSGSTYELEDLNGKSGT